MSRSSFNALLIALWLTLRHFASFNIDPSGSPEKLSFNFDPFAGYDDFFQLH